MTFRQKTLTLAVWCDKPSCDRSIRVPDPEWATYGNKFRTWLRATGWSTWVNRGTRHYCPDHGPSPKSNLRRIDR